MGAGGSVDIAGTISVTGTNGSGGEPFALSQTLAEVQPKTLNLTIPPGGSSVNISLNFSPTVTEALFLAIEAQVPVKIELTSSDAVHPGPFRMGIKGPMLITAYPGEGITNVSIMNPDPINSTEITVVVASAPDSSTIPPFWSAP